MLTSLQLQTIVQICLNVYGNETAYGKPITFHVRRVVQRAIAKDYHNEIIALCWLHDYHKVAGSVSYAKGVIDSVKDVDKKLAKDLEILTPQNYGSLRLHYSAILNSAYPRIVKSLCLADEVLDMPPGEERNISLEYLGKFIEKVDGVSINLPQQVPLIGN